eukprot:12501125-Prorocentrum_lima.AAC.1
MLDSASLEEPRAGVTHAGSACSAVPNTCIDTAGSTDDIPFWRRHVGHLRDHDMTESLRAPGTTCRRIPPSIVGQFRRLLGDVCTAINAAIDSNNGEQQDLEKLLLLLPRLILQVHEPGQPDSQTKGREHPGIHQQVVARWAQLQQGEWNALLTPLTSSRSSSEQPRSEQCKADTIVRAIAANNIGKASRLLSTPGLAPNTTATRSQLTTLLQPSGFEQPPETDLAGSRQGNAPTLVELSE